MSGIDEKGGGDSYRRKKKNCFRDHVPAHSAVHRQGATLLGKWGWDGRGNISRIKKKNAKYQHCLIPPHPEEL